MRKRVSILFFFAITGYCKSQDTVVFKFPVYNSTNKDSVEMIHKLLIGTWMDGDDSLHTLLIRKDTMLDIREPKYPNEEERISEFTYEMYTQNTIITYAHGPHGIIEGHMHIYLVDHIYLNISRGADLYEGENPIEGYVRFISPIH
jgi:hypothetical protein